MKKFIVLDLETTFDSNLKMNRIIEIGFVIIQNKQIISRYEQIINPKVKLSKFVSDLTNLTSEDLQKGVSFKEAYSSFKSQIDDAVIVAHQAQVDVKTLNDELDLIKEEALLNLTLDTVELSKILYPTLKSYKLTDLADSLGISYNKAHRALDDAEMTAELFLKMQDKLSNLPKNTIYHLYRLRNYLISDLLEILPIKKENNLTEMNHYKDLPYLKQEIKQFKQSHLELNIDEIFKLDGILNKKLPNYSKRQEQIDLAHVIEKSLKEKSSTVIEAPTGIGKSLAYLIPASLLSLKYSEQIIISTYTNLLQSQLLNNELKLVNEVFDKELIYTELRGMTHYIDLERFYSFLMSNKTDNYPTIILKAKVLIWLTETKTGLLDELNLEPAMFNQLINIQTLSKNSKTSYYQYSLLRAKNAKLVIINHALYLSQIENEDSFILKSPYIIFDEAHRLPVMINEKNLTLLESRQVYSLSHYLKYNFDFELIDEIKILYTELLAFIYKMSEHYYENQRIISLNKFKGILDTFNLLNVKLNQLIKKIDLESLPQFVKEQIEQMQKTLYILIDALYLDKPIMMLLEYRYNNLEWKLIHQTINKVVTQLPLHQTKIYISGTLSVRKKFKYFDQIMKTDKLPHHTFNTPFKLDKQVKMYAIKDLPTVKDPEYALALAEFIYSLKKHNKGRVLVLFTSFMLLEEVYDLVSPVLESQTILSQHESNDLARTRTLFKQEQDSILFGTESFWEGIDLESESIDHLVITRLPFKYKEDPYLELVSTRENAFKSFALPEAVLKFKQGIGRLIRHEADHGKIYVTDNRILTANYRTFFSESIKPIQIESIEIANLFK